MVVILLYPGIHILLASLLNFPVLYKWLFVKFVIQKPLVEVKAYNNFDTFHLITTTPVCALQVWLILFKKFIARLTWSNTNTRLDFWISFRCSCPAINFFYSGGTDIFWKDFWDVLYVLYISSRSMHKNDDSVMLRGMIISST